jgi:hypothetical protein
MNEWGNTFDELYNAYLEKFPHHAPFLQNARPTFLDETDLRSMIDLSLMRNDKAWFTQLMTRLDCLYAWGGKTIELY